MTKLRRPSALHGSHARPPHPARLSHVVEARSPRSEAPRFVARMVDVGAKPVRARVAIARAEVVFPRGVLASLLARPGAVVVGRRKASAGRVGADMVLQGPKGPIEELARAAGILAAKRTGELVPLCHPIGLDVVEIEFDRIGDDRLEVRCRAACRGRTGVEMEAMIGVTVAALTIYDMTKALDPAIAVERVELVEKHGGKSGVWRRGDASAHVEKRTRRAPRKTDARKR